MQIHWLSVTVHASHEVALGFWDLFLLDAFGAGAHGPGGMFYTASLVGLSGARLYTLPIDSKDDYWTISLPGKACESVSLDWFKAVEIYLSEWGYRYSVTRLDLAFDDWPYSPLEMKEAEMRGDIVSPARARGLLGRRSEWIEGVDGNTWSIGTRSGGRYVRVYDRRGCNRCEIELRNEYAHDALSTLFLDHPGKMDAFAKSHIEKFLRVDNGRVYDLPYKEWLENSLIMDTKTFRPSRDVNLEGLDAWQVRQCSVVLSVLADVAGWDYINDLVEIGYAKREAKKKQYKRYAALVDCYSNLLPSALPQLYIRRVKNQKMTVGLTPPY